MNGSDAPAGPLLVSPEVALAIGDGRPVVALESTLISHGLPYPANWRAARGAEAAARDESAVPATIAVLGGTIRVGLDDEALADLAGRPAARPVLKAGRRDLATAVARGLDAATTVSATARVARLAGIGVMATGGLGGVHREASRTFDISNDLDELARADGLVVVCSGAKSILDLPATLELLETLGVPVIGYRTDTVPAFLSTSSGLPAPARADTPEEAAAIVRAHRALGLPGAVLIAQPVPADLGVDPDAFEAAVADALYEAGRKGVAGKEVTPFLLERLRDLLGEDALGANVALIEANARLAAAIASALAGPAV